MAVRPFACLLAVRWRDGTPEGGTLRGRLARIGISADRLAGLRPSRAASVRSRLNWGSPVLAEVPGALSRLIWCTARGCTALPALPVAACPVTACRTASPSGWLRL